MAHKRMYSRDITDSDSFTGLSAAAQALYFHLNQGADDDGLNNQVRTAMAKAHANTQALRALAERGLVIRFDSGVVAIRHWRVHNTLRRDRYSPTKCTREWEMLRLENGGVYELQEQLRLPDGCRDGDAWLPDVCLRKEEKRKEENRIEKERKADAGRSPAAGPGGTPQPPESSFGKLPFQMPTLEQVRQYCRQRGNRVDPQRWFDYYTANGWKMGKSPMRDWQAAVRTWERTHFTAEPAGFLEIMEDLDE